MIRAVWRMSARTGPGSSMPPAARGVGAVRGLVGAHLLHDGAAARSAARQAAEVLIQMALDLALRLHHEAEAGPVARPARRARR